MKFILDTADTVAIAKYNTLLTIDGVTTNPTIITRSGKDPKAVLQEIITILNDDQKLFVQVVATDLEGILKEAEWIHSLRKHNIFIKIPVTHVGLQAIKACKAKGYKVLATAVYSAQQGLMAALNGADCIAPYVNRMCNFGDGIQEVLNLQTTLEKHRLPSYIVAASFKNTKQVLDLLKGGVEAVTVPIDVVEAMINHPSTQEAVNDFTIAWQNAYHRNTIL